ncbi:BamA/TamA family outer membrane protein [Candidatus Poribacteria bacterium]|nr:BamA/TamA family outer membrane protein [Candidatus Poribacteria bacterium]MYG07459.1 BamA/TamA family outer membrane protein [Candidatus Poribacteria bacterium]MYK22528.1 BamA/TamA family outer membrane protein [Candidatus Poribacteria bacterium]
MGAANYNTFIDRVICLIFMFCCFFLQSVGANAPTETSADIRAGDFVLRQAFGTTRIDKIEYRIDTEVVAETTEQYDRLSKQTSVGVEERLSPYAIQQSIKRLYATQQYSHIHVYAQEYRNGVALIYQLTSFDLITAVVITGMPPSQFRSAIENAVKSKPGGRYVPAIAKADIIHIRRICRDHGYFDAQVTVADTLTETGVLTYQIHAGDPSRIKRVQIQDNFAISNDRLIAACKFSRLYPIYNKTNVETDVAAMEALYRKNTYPTATVVPTFMPETGLLQFNINEGKQVQFNFVSGTGELSLSQQDTFREDIAEVISTGAPSLWEGRIKAYFKNEGYHDTTVQEKASDAASVHLTINPGTRYRVTRVSFSGNRAFLDADLLREMTVKPTVGLLGSLRLSNLVARFLSRQEQKRFFYQDDLETDEHRLHILYERAGYPNAVITATPKKQPLNNRNIGEVEIHVSIFEDRKEVIHRCVISGNRAIDTATLLKGLESELQLPQPNAVLERTVYQDAVRHAYRERGYSNAKVNDTYIPETETAAFEVEGNFSESLSVGNLPLEIRDEFKRYNLTLAGFFIATNVGNRWSIQDIEGNPRYTLKQEPTHLAVFEHGILNLNVETEGEQVTFGKFYFEGDTDVVKPHVLKREVAHLEGELWTSDKLSRALQNLYGLGIFRAVQYRRVQAEPIETQKVEGDNAVKTPDTRNPHPMLKTDDVLITAKKKLPRTFNYGGGYSFAEGWNGALELTNSNFLFKRNIRGSFRSTLGWRDELGYLVDARLTEPWLIGRTRGTLQVSAKKLERDDNVRALQGSFILRRKLGKSHSLDLRYSYRDLNQPVPPMRQGTPTEIRLPEEQNPFSTTVSSLRFSWTYDRRVRYLNPIGGMFNEMTLEYAGGFLQGGTSFIKTTTDTRYYQKLIGSLVLATAVRCGITTGLRSNRSAELISFERFWAGGSTTVRGYAERSLGPEDITGTYRGDVQFIFNTELRFPIYSVVRGAFFFDAGNVWNSLADIERKLTRLPSAVGAGLYLDFGALTFGLDYAIPLVSVPSSPDTRRAHVRLGSPF